MKRRRHDPVEARQAIPRVLSELGLGGAAAALRVVACWPGVVGEETARHAEPTGLRGEVLEVRADSSVWCQQLALRQDPILAGLRQALGDEAPTRMRLHVG